jgi:hypothetical protein
MVSILQIDGLGKRYGLLPSEIIKRADTFDLYIMDAALSFEHYHNKKASGKNVPPDLTNDELMSIFNKGKDQSVKT